MVAVLENLFQQRTVGVKLKYTNASLAEGAHAEIVKRKEVFKENAPILSLLRLLDILFVLFCEPEKRSFPSARAAHIFASGIQARKVS